MKKQTHELKVWKEFFPAIQNGEKTFEVRLNDRNFQVGDLLILKEWDNENARFTFRKEHKRVKYILKGGQFGIAEGYVVISL